MNMESQSLNLDQIGPDSKKQLLDALDVFARSFSSEANEYSFLVEQLTSESTKDDLLVAMKEVVRDHLGHMDSFKAAADNLSAILQAWYGGFNSDQIDKLVRQSKVGKEYWPDSQASFKREAWYDLGEDKVFASEVLESYLVGLLHSYANLTEPHLEDFLKKVKEDEETDESLLKELFSDETENSAPAEQETGQDEKLKAATELVQWAQELGFSQFSPEDLLDKSKLLHCLRPMFYKWIGLENHEYANRLERVVGILKVLWREIIEDQGAQKNIVVRRVLYMVNRSRNDVYKRLLKVTTGMDQYFEDELIALAWLSDRLGDTDDAPANSSNGSGPGQSGKNEGFFIPEPTTSFTPPPVALTLDNNGTTAQSETEEERELPANSTGKENAQEVQSSRVSPQDLNDQIELWLKDKSRVYEQRIQEAAEIAKKLVPAYRDVDVRTLVVEPEYRWPDEVRTNVASFLGDLDFQKVTQDSIEKALLATELELGENQKIQSLKEKSSDLEIPLINEVMTALAQRTHHELNEDQIKAFDAFVDLIVQARGEMHTFNEQVDEHEHKATRFAEWAASYLPQYKGMLAEDIKIMPEGLSVPERNAALAQIIKEYAGFVDWEILNKEDIQGLIDRMAQDNPLWEEPDFIQKRFEKLHANVIAQSINALDDGTFSGLSKESVDMLDLYLKEVFVRQRLHKELQSEQKQLGDILKALQTEDMTDKDFNYIVSHVLPSIFEEPENSSFAECFLERDFDWNSLELKRTADQLYSQAVDHAVKTVEHLDKIDDQRATYHHDLTHLFEYLKSNVQQFGIRKKQEFQRQYKDLLGKSFGENTREKELLDTFHSEHPLEQYVSEEEFKGSLEMHTFLGGLGNLLVEYGLQLPDFDIIKMVDESHTPEDIQAVVDKTIGMQFLLDHLPPEATLAVVREQKPSMKELAKKGWNGMLSKMKFWSKNNNEEAPVTEDVQAYNFQNAFTQYVNENIYGGKHRVGAFTQQGLAATLEMVEVKDFSVDEFQDTVSSQLRGMYEYDNGKSLENGFNAIVNYADQLKAQLTGFVDPVYKSDTVDGLVERCLEEGLFNDLLDKPIGFDEKVDMSAQRGNLLAALEASLKDITTGVDSQDLASIFGDPNASSEPHELLDRLTSLRRFIDVAESFLSHDDIQAIQSNALEKVEELLGSYEPPGKVKSLWTAQKTSIVRQLKKVNEGRKEPLMNVEDLVQLQNIGLIKIKLRQTGEVIATDITQLDKTDQYDIVPILDHYSWVDTSENVLAEDILPLYYDRLNLIKGEIRENGQVLEGVHRLDRHYGNYLESKQEQLSQAYLKILEDLAGYAEQAFDTFISLDGTSQELVWKTIRDLKRTLDQNERDGWEFDRDIYNRIDTAYAKLQAERVAVSVTQQLKSLEEQYGDLVISAQEKRFGHNNGWIKRTFKRTKEKGKSLSLRLMDALAFAHKPLFYTGDNKVLKALTSPLTYTIGGGVVLGSVGLAGVGLSKMLPSYLGFLGSVVGFAGAYTGYLGGALGALSGASGIEWYISGKRKLPETDEEIEALDSSELLQVLEAYLVRDLMWSFDETTSEFFEQDHIQTLMERIEDDALGTSGAQEMIQNLEMLEQNINGLVNQSWLRRRKDTKRLKKTQEERKSQEGSSNTN